MPEITKEKLEIKVEQLRLAIAKIAALTITGEDVSDVVLRICKSSVSEYMIRDAYVNLLTDKVEAKLKEVVE